MARSLDDNKRMEILRVARQKFGRQGYGQTSMGEIAREAGVAHGTIYLYFPSKEALTLALSEEFYARLSAVVLPAAERVTQIEDVVTIVRGALHFVEEQSDLVRMVNLYTELAAVPMDMPERRGFYKRLALIFEEKIAQGIVHDYDPRAVAELVAGMVEWAGVPGLVRGSGRAANYEETLLNFIRRALEPERATGNGQRATGDE